VRPELEPNCLLWDERVGHHRRSAFYDADGFVAGTHDPLRDFELEELGDVAGLDLVHLQCHFGLDTLAWARRGARVTGLDFSGTGVEAAREIAAAAGLEATFVQADVHDAVDALGAHRFDVVYTGFGALNWLPDVAAWAQVVSGLLRPGGRLYLAEFHPFTDVFDWQERVVARSYFDRSAQHDDSEGTYTDTDPDARFEHTASVEWQHPLGDVVTAVAGAGLVVRALREHDVTLYPRWPDLEADERGIHRLPAGEPSLPLVYTLLASAPS